MAKGAYEGPVRATARGYYGGAIREPGDLFIIADEADLGSWMEPVDGDAAAAAHAADADSKARAKDARAARKKIKDTPTPNGDGDGLSDAYASDED